MTCLDDARSPSSPILPVSRPVSGSRSIGPLRFRGLLRDRARSNAIELA